MPEALVFDHATGAKATGIPFPGPVNGIQPTPDFETWRTNVKGMGNLETWVLDNIMQYQDAWNFGVDHSERVPPRIAFPNMRAHGGWDYDSVAHRTRKPRTDGRTRTEIRESFVFSPSGEPRSSRAWATCTTTSTWPGPQ